MKFEVHIHNHGDSDFEQKILKKLNTIMAAIDDLKAQVESLTNQTTELQASVDAEQAQIQALLDTNATVVNDLNAQIATLQEQVNNGATPEQLTEVSTSLQAIADSLATTKADIESTASDTPPSDSEA